MSVTFCPFIFLLILVWPTAAPSEDTKQLQATLVSKVYLGPHFGRMNESGPVKDQCLAGTTTAVAETWQCGLYAEL